MIRRAIILLICVIVLLLATYIYAHYNWHPLPAGTTIDRILVEK